MRVCENQAVNLFVDAAVEIMEFWSRSSGSLQKGSFPEARTLGTHASGVRMVVVNTNSFKLQNNTFWRAVGSMDGRAVGQTRELAAGRWVRTYVRIDGQTYIR